MAEEASTFNSWLNSLIPQVPPVDDSEKTSEERIEEDASDFAAFLERQKKLQEEAERQGLTPLPAVNADSVPDDSALSIDVTNPIRAGEDPTRDYEFMYGKEPELGFLTSVKAKLGDIFNPEGLPSASQETRDAYLEELEAFDARAQEIYENSVEMDLPEAKILGIDFRGMADDELISDGKVRVYRFLDDNNEVKNVLVPRPGSNMFERIVGQAGRTIWSELYGLVERREDGSLDVNFLEDSEYSQAVPDYDQQMGEGLLTDLRVFGVPGVAAEKGFRKGAGVLTDQVKKGDKFIPDGSIGSTVKYVGSKSETAFKYIGGSLGIALTEGALSEEGDKGLIFSDTAVKNVFTGVNDEEAKDVAMVIDGLVVNLGFDTLLGIAGKVLRLGIDKVRAGRGLVDKKYVRDNASRESILGVITKIDPSLVDANAKQVSEAIRTLSKVLNENSSTIARIGSSTADVPVDTVNALAQGATKYIEVTRQSLQNTMSPENWAKYVEKEANEIVMNTIGLARGAPDGSKIRDRQAQMVGEVGELFDTEAARINPDNVNFNESTVPEIVETKNLDLQEIDAEISTAEMKAANARVAQGTSVQEDPFIAGLIEEVDPSRFFDDTEYVQRLTDLYGDTFVKEYRAAYDAVKVAYEAIPNDPIDMVSFKTQLANVFNSAGGLGEATQDAAPILAKLKQVFGDKISPSKEPSLMGDPRDAASAVTPQQVIDGLTDEIGFQDLYTLKKEIDKLISATNNRNVAASLRELRDHITSKAVDEAGEATGQLAYVSRNGGDAAELAKAADDLFIETQSKFQNSLTTKGLSDASFTPAYAGTNTPVPPGGSTRGQPDLETQAVSNTESMLSDRTGNQLEQLQFALSDALSKGEVNKPFIDLFVAKQTSRLAKALRNNDSQTISEIDTAFEGVIDQLRQLDSPLVEELNAAKARIMSVQNELGNSALAADELADMARQRKIAAEDTIVAKFLSKNKTGAPISTPSIIVRNQLNGADAGNFIDGLMAEIDKLPIEQQAPARQATQSMLLRTVRDIVTTSTPISADGTKDIALGQLERLTNARASGLIDAVSRAFPENEFMRETISVALGSLKDLSLSARLKVARSGSDTVINSGLRDSVSTGILFTFGYMNPTAAAARRITSTQIEAMEKLSKEKQAEMIGIILAEPEEFAQLAELIAKGVSPSRLVTAGKNLLNIVNRTKQYTLRVSNEDEQTDSIILDTAAAAEGFINNITE